MAKVFLDANAVIDLVERKGVLATHSLDHYVLHISPLSLHILAYVYKYRCPSEVLQSAFDAFSVVALDEGVAARAALGPTTDYEDNIQLQSASSSQCSYFITSDQALLKMGIFGTTRIISEFPAE